jgi:CRP/FNR family transcriptional regulator
MNAQRNIGTFESTSGLSELCCSACAAYDVNLCEAASAAPWAMARPEPIHISQTAYTVAARRIICREQDLHDTVPIICSGWAASVVMLSDGSRQILSFLLPGDIVSTALLFEPTHNYSIEAITEVRYRAFNRSELRDLLFKRPDLLNAISKAWIEEKTRSDQLIVDLGRRAADERIARLILNLVERLTKRGMAEGESAELDFPLRQHHIADATGLTPVHVGKVLSEFRRRGLLKINARSLIILDPAGFQRVARMRQL